MRAALDALASTKDSRALPILLAKAQPGQMERVRLTALAGLAEFAQGRGGQCAHRRLSQCRREF